MSVDDRLSRYLSKDPQIDDSAFVAATATIVGDVSLAEQSSVWYQAVLRGDINSISIGVASNIQDGVIGHLSDDYPLIVEIMLQWDMELYFMLVPSMMNA